MGGGGGGFGGEKGGGGGGGGSLPSVTRQPLHAFGYFGLIWQYDYGTHPYKMGGTSQEYPWTIDGNWTYSTSVANFQCSDFKTRRDSANYLT